jgi:hypothetical protein
MFLKGKPPQRLLSSGEVEETIDPPVLQSSQIAGDMDVMCSQPGEVFRVGNHRKFAADSNQPLGGSIDAPLDTSLLVDAIVLLPVDDRSMHPAVVIALSEIIEVGVIVCASYFVAIEDHGHPADQKLCACIIMILATAKSTAAGSLRSSAFSNPHNEASDPLIRASFVFGFTEKSAPVANDPGWRPE